MVAATQLGKILREEGLVLLLVTVKADEDIEKGEFIQNVGDGFLAAAAAQEGPALVSIEAHDYSEVSYHKISAVLKGEVVAQKTAATGAVDQGQYVELSSTAGECQIFDYTSPGAWFEGVGTCLEDALTGDTAIKLSIPR